MVLLRFLAFPSEAAPAREAKSAPLRAPAPPSRRTPVPAAAPARSPVAQLGQAQGVAVHQPAAPMDMIATIATIDAARAPGSPSAQPALTGPTVPAVPRALGDRWQALVLSLVERGGIAALVRELAWSSALIAIDERTEPPTWRLVVEREALRQKALADKLAAALVAAVGSAVQLELEPGVPEDSPARRDSAERARRQAEAEATIQSDPVVRELLAQFKGARIVPGSIKPV
jgi:DNA polymerase-3 subunit gamma/tau